MVSLQMPLNYCLTESGSLHLLHWQLETTKRPTSTKKAEMKGTATGGLAVIGGAPGAVGGGILSATIVEGKKNNKEKKQVTGTLER